MNTIVLVILGVVALAIIWLIFVYNGLITLRNRTQEAWSDIDVQLKRRYDLIPNLVETVKGYASHEKQLFENVTKARSEAMQAQGAAAKAKAENMLTDTLKSLFAVAENYPNLRASENFAKLQDELSDTENKIQSARRFYNTNVMDLNTKIEQFPGNLIANGFGFKREQFFEITATTEREPVPVKF